MTKTKTMFRPLDMRLVGDCTCYSLTILMNDEMRNVWPRPGPGTVQFKKPLRRLIMTIPIVHSGHRSFYCIHHYLIGTKAFTASNHVFLTTDTND
jgi:hypothetical protein